MLRLYLKTWEWELIFGRAVKSISTLGVHSPCSKLCKEITFQCPSTLQPNMKSWWNLKISRDFLSWNHLEISQDFLSRNYLKISRDFLSRNYLEISQNQEVSLQSIMNSDFVAKFEDPVKTIDTLLRFSYLYHRVTLEQFS